MTDQPHRAHNFSAGPSGLPLDALVLAREELLDFEGTGMSIMEQSHRGKEYDRVHEETLKLLRDLLAVPETHDILLLQGGASQQFAVVPLNLLPPGASADYVVTGGWSEKALAEARLVGDVKVAATTEVTETDRETGKPIKVYRRIPRHDELTLDPKAAYVHVTSNNTLFGTQWSAFPRTEAPLVADMSSDFLSAPLDVSRFGLIYAGAQKNIGPSGLTVVIIRKDLIEKGRKDIPRIFRYETHAKDNSLYHTPPTFAIYLARNVLRWAVSVGGVAGLEARNRIKAARLYAAIDELPDFYRCPVERESRSLMNVVFRLPTQVLEDRFVAESKKADLIGLKGHRLTGGIRASLYNAVSPESVTRLVEFMHDFARAS